MSLTPTLMGHLRVTKAPVHISTKTKKRREIQSDLSTSSTAAIGTSPSNSIDPSPFTLFYYILFVHPRKMSATDFTQKCIGKITIRNPVLLANAGSVLSFLPVWHIFPSTCFSHTDQKNHSCSWLSLNGGFITHSSPARHVRRRSLELG